MNHEIATKIIAIFCIRNVLLYITTAAFALMLCNSLNETITIVASYLSMYEYYNHF